MNPNHFTGPDGLLDEAVFVDNQHENVTDECLQKIAQLHDKVMVTTL